MQEPFDIETGNTHYAVFPEGNDIYTILKDGKEYLQIQKDAEAVWIKLDEQTELPIFDEDPEVNAIGKAINAYIESGGEDEEEDEDY